MARNGQSEWIEKSAIMSALSLYLNFLNMFLFLLQFLGNRELKLTDYLKNTKAAIKKRPLIYLNLT
jgi:hypothetical protein